MVFANVPVGTSRSPDQPEVVARTENGWFFLLGLNGDIYVSKNEGASWLLAYKSGGVTQISREDGIAAWGNTLYWVVSYSSGGWRYYFYRVNVTSTPTDGRTINYFATESPTGQPDNYRMFGFAVNKSGRMWMGFAGTENDTTYLRFSYINNGSSTVSNPINNFSVRNLSYWEARMGIKTDGNPIALLSHSSNYASVVEVNSSLQASMWASAPAVGSKTDYRMFMDGNNVMHIVMPFDGEYLYSTTPIKGNSTAFNKVTGWINSSYPISGQYSASITPDGKLTIIGASNSTRLVKYVKESGSTSFSYSALENITSGNLMHVLGGHNYGNDMDYIAAVRSTGTDSCRVYIEVFDLSKWKRWDGGAWRNVKQVNRWTGTQWAKGTPHRWSGTQWVRIT